MKKKGFILFMVFLLTMSSPAMAIPNPVQPMESARQVWDQVQLLLPLPTEATELSYSVIDKALAQVHFSYNGSKFLLRQENTAAFEDISGLYITFENTHAWEGALSEKYECTVAWNDEYGVAWWFDPVRSVSGSLCIQPGTLVDFDTILPQVFNQLELGAAYAGNAACQKYGFKLDIPAIQTEDDARTAKINDHIQLTLDKVVRSHAATASFKQQYMVSSLYHNIYSISWGGTVSMSFAAYDVFQRFTINLDLSTGEAAPLAAVKDNGALAEDIHKNFGDYYILQDDDNQELADAQMDYLSSLDLDGWKLLLDGADLYTDAGLPSVFSFWSCEEPFAALVLHISVPHALQDWITLNIPRSVVTPLYQ